jgi:hypothetical protein
VLVPVCWAHQAAECNTDASSCHRSRELQLSTSGPVATGGDKLTSLHPPLQVETLAASEECDIDGVPHIKATDALNLDVDLPTGTEAAGMTQVI